MNKIEDKRQYDLWHYGFNAPTRTLFDLRMIVWIEYLESKGAKSILEMTLQEELDAYYEYRELGIA